MENALLIVQEREAEGRWDSRVLDRYTGRKTCGGEEATRLLNPGSTNELFIQTWTLSLGDYTLQGLLWRHWEQRRVLITKVFASLLQVFAYSVEPFLMKKN